MGTKATAPVLQRASPAKRKPLGVRVTPEQHALLTEAARHQHRSVSSFVLQSALASAEQLLPARKPRKTVDEVRSILNSARVAVRQAIPEGEDFLEDFLAERRRLAADE